MLLNVVCFLSLGVYGWIVTLWCGPRMTSLPLPRYVVRGD